MTLNDFCKAKGIRFFQSGKTFDSGRTRIYCLDKTKFELPIRVFTDKDWDGKFKEDMQVQAIMDDVNPDKFVAFIITSNVEERGDIMSALSFGSDDEEDLPATPKRKKK